jgi:hypothetical protein
MVSEADFIAAQDISAARGPAPDLPLNAPVRRRKLLYPFAVAIDTAPEHACWIGASHLGQVGPALRKRLRKVVVRQADGDRPVADG